MITRSGEAVYLSPSPCEAPRLPLIPYICLPLAELEEEARLDLLTCPCTLEWGGSENMGQTLNSDAFAFFICVKKMLHMFLNYLNNNKTV